MSGEITDKLESVIKGINDKLPGLAQQYATAIANEEALRALCEKKLLAQVGSFLAAQTEITQVPFISLAYS